MSTNLVTEGGEAEYELRPFFVSLTPDIKITDHKGREARAAFRPPARSPTSSFLPMRRLARHQSLGRRG